MQARQGLPVSHRLGGVRSGRAVLDRMLPHDCCVTFITSIRINQVGCQEAPIEGIGGTVKVCYSCALRQCLNKDHTCTQQPQTNKLAESAAMASWEEKFTFSNWKYRHYFNLSTSHATTKLVAKNHAIHTVVDAVDYGSSVANVSSANNEGHRATPSKQLKLDIPAPASHAVTQTKLNGMIVQYVVQNINR